VEAGRPDVGRQNKVKLHLEIDGNAGEAEFSQSGDGARLEWNGARYEAEINENEPGLYVVLIDGVVYRCEFHPLQGGGAEITVNGHRILTRVRDLKHLRGAGTTSSAESGRVELSSPMPGKLVRILVEAGKDVKAGEGVIIVEAMKMQTTVYAPVDGQVREMLVHAGQTVDTKDLLLTIESTVLTSSPSSFASLRHCVIDVFEA
jgi:biotin carboxyl carrier protein